MLAVTTAARSSPAFCPAPSRKAAGRQTAHHASVLRLLSGVSRRAGQSSPQPRSQVLTRAEPDPPQELYPRPGWPWQYPAAKPGTTLADSPAFLWLTQATHYAIFITQLWLAYRIYELCGTPAVVAAVALPFWVMVCPIFQALAGFGPVLMHEYEGWQIAPFRDAVAGPVDPAQANNQQLREAAFRVLFQFQAIASGMMVLGVFGVQEWTLLGRSLPAPIPQAILIGGLVWVYAARRFPTVMFDAGVLGLGLPAKPVFPVPLDVLPPFAIAVVGYTLAQAHFLAAVHGQAAPGAQWWLWAVAISLLNTAGGMMEGLVAESTFNQKWHLGAVVLLNGGGLLQLWLLAGL